MIKVDSFIKIVLAAALLLLGVSVFYYLVVFLPHKEQAKLDQQREGLAAKERLERQQEEEVEADLEECLSEVGDRYKSSWLEACRSLGLISSGCFIETDPINFQDCICELPNDVVVRLDNLLTEGREACFVFWPDAAREEWEGWE